MILFNHTAGERESHFKSFPNEKSTWLGEHYVSFLINIGLLASRVKFIRH